jgi:clan AA aspartic protease (TIGR02281 family)
MFRRRCIGAALLLVAAAADRASAGYLDENPDEVFAGVYTRLGVTLPMRMARDPYVWLRLEELKREPCDQKSVNDLSQFLEKQGYRREAAESTYNFVRNCKAPIEALHWSVDIFLKLSDYSKAIEVADEFVRRAPANHNARYLRGAALEGLGDFKRALIDYADAIELFSLDRKEIASTVFLRMANAYASLGRFCEAASPIYAWVAIDPVSRDTSRTQKIIADYEQRGNCVATKEFQKERYPLRGQRNVVPVKVEVNGVKGTFTLDTGASYVSVKSEFAERAKIASTDANEITLFTANGAAKGKLSKADKVQLGRLQAVNVPVVVQKLDAKSYGPGIDGLLGMSFLSRFELQMAGGYIEIRTRRPK